jgi:RHS repeat-associated protein
VENGSSGVYTQFVFSPSGQKVAVVRAGSLVKGTVPLPGGATAIYSGTSGMPYIRHKDWLGSARLATTWSHGVQSKVAYAPFGETYNEAGASSNDRSFTGQDQDTVTANAATGIYDFMFRKYDPAAGRWLSPDPLGWGAVGQGDPQSLDRYAYVTNRPMSLTDPTGLDGCGTGGAGSGVSLGAGQCLIWWDDRTPYGSAEWPNYNLLGSTIGPWIPGAHSDEDGNFDTCYADPIFCSDLATYNFFTIAPFGSGGLGGLGGSGGGSTFTKVHSVPRDAQACNSSGKSFYAPPNWDINAIIAAGMDGGKLPGGLSAMNQAVNHYGTYDYQRSRDAARNTTFYSAYTPVSNISVGAYLYGAGYSLSGAISLATTAAYLIDASNAGDPALAQYWTLGYNMAAQNVGYLCSINPMAQWRKRRE